MMARTNARVDGLWTLTVDFHGLMAVEVFQEARAARLHLIDSATHHPLIVADLEYVAEHASLPPTATFTPDGLVTFGVWRISRRGSVALVDKTASGPLDCLIGDRPDDDAAHATSLRWLPVLRDLLTTEPLDWINPAFVHSEINLSQGRLCSIPFDETDKSKNPQFRACVDGHPVDDARSYAKGMRYEIDQTFGDAVSLRLESGSLVVHAKSADQGAMVSICNLPTEGYEDHVNASHHFNSYCRAVESDKEVTFIPEAWACKDGAMRTRRLDSSRFIQYPPQCDPAIILRD